jgi:dTDP-L-rhamnose 4-epimerase
LEVANQINDFYGGRSELKVTGAFREGDIRHGLADLTQAQALLKYQPRWRFAEGLRKFLEWANQSAPVTSGYEQSLMEMKERGLLRG